MLGVTSPSSMVRSRSRIRKSLIVSQRFSRLLTWSMSLHVGADVGVRGQPGVVGLDHAPRRRPLGQRVRVEGDQRGRVVPTLRVHDHLAGQRARGLEQRLDRPAARCTCRPEVLIRSFLRSVIRSRPSLVDLADVARGQPAVGVEHLVGRVRQAVVAAHHAGPAQQDLAVGRDPHLGAGDRRPDLPEDRVVEPDDAGSGAGLGQPVALEDHHPGGVEPRGDVRGERRAAGDQEPDPAAEPVADLREHQAVGHDVLGPGQRSGPACREAGLRDPAARPGTPSRTGRP